MGFMIFKNRIEAGKQLAEFLTPIKDQDLVILGLPRGGVPVAYEVAKRLKKPLDVLIVRKLGVPWQPELAFGAIGEGEVLYLNDLVINDLAIAKKDQEEVIAEQKSEILKRQIRFRGERGPLDIKEKVVVIVDDGIATGATAMAACKVAATLGASQVIIAAPVATQESVAKLIEVTTANYILETPSDFYAVGQWYEDFSTVTDEEVINILDRYRREYGN